MTQTPPQDSVSDVERVVVTPADRRAMEQWACMTVDLSFDEADAEGLVEAFAKHRTAALAVPINKIGEDARTYADGVEDAAKVAADYYAEPG